MKRCALWLLGLLVLGVLPVAAQFTNNYQTNVINGTTVWWPQPWPYPVDTYRIGDTYMGNVLVVTNGGVLWTGPGYLGVTVAGSNAAVLITGTGSAWRTTGGYLWASLYIGSAGAHETIIVENGGQLSSAYDARIGYGVTSSRNRVTVTGAGSSWMNNDELTVGWDGGENSVIISNGAVVGNTAGRVGLNTSGSNNVVVVTGVGSAWNNRGTLTVGGGGAGNTLLIADGGLVSNTVGYVGFSSSSNVVSVVGTNSMWKNSGNLFVGYSRGSNALAIADGGRVSASNVVVGQASSDNRVSLANGTLSAASITVNGTNVLAGYGAILSQSFLNRGVVEANQSGGTLSVSGEFLNLGELRATNGGALEFWGPVLDYGSSTFAGGTAVFHGVHLTTSGATNSWIGSGDGSWATSTAWSSGRVPSDSDSLVLVTNDSSKTVVVDAAVTSQNLGAYALTISAAAGMTNTVRVQDMGDTFYVVNLTVGSGGCFEVTNALVRVGLLGYGQCDVDGSVRVQDATLNGTGVTNRIGLTTSSRVVVERGIYQVGDFFLGQNSDGNCLNVGAGGTAAVYNAYVGYNATSSNNMATVAGSGAFLGAQSNLWVGRDGAVNTLLITNGGVVSSKIGYVGYGFDSSNNMALVSGAGSVWSNSADFTLGYYGSQNQLIITNGGKVFSALNNGDVASVGSQVSSIGNVVVVTGTGSVWKCGQVVLNVGAAGSQNRLTIQEGAVVSDGSGYVGNTTNATGNAVLVSGSGSAWSNANSLLIGASGSGNSMVISNGGTVYNSNLGTIGDQGTSSNNSVIVTGTGSVWNAGGQLTVGFYGSGNSLTICDGGSASGYGVIGFWSGASRNSVLVTDPGSVWVPGNLVVGNSGTGNSLTISNGGVVTSAYSKIGNNGASDNSVLVTGTGSTWYASELKIGVQSPNNHLTIRDGGAVEGGTSFIGDRADGNSVLITDPGSAWRVNGDLYVGYPWIQGGYQSAGNSLTLSNGGMARAYGLYVGWFSGDTKAASNFLTVAGGGILVTNNTRSAIFEVRKGFLRLTDAVVSADRWVMTNTAPDVVRFDSGTISTCAALLDFGTNAFSLGTIAGSTATWFVGTSNHNVNTPQLIVGAGGGATGIVSIVGDLFVSGTVYAGSNSVGLGLGNVVVSNGLLSAAGLISGFGGSGTISNTGGLFMFNTATPQIVTNTEASIVASNAGLGYLNVSNAPVDWRATQLANITWESVPNRYRLNNSTNAMVGAYRFGFSNGEGYRGLEFVGGTSTWRSVALLVGDGGTLLVSNAVATIQTLDQQLTVTNGGRVLNRSSFAGFNPASSGFTVLLDGDTAVWDGDMAVGYRGANNRLIVTNGAKLYGAINVGYWSNANNNSVLLTGSGTVWSNSSDLYVGREGSSNLLTISAGAVVSNFGYGTAFIGAGGTANWNRVEVTGTGSAWLSDKPIVVGYQGTNNSVVVSSGGAVSNGTVYLGWFGHNNSVVVSGAGSSWSNSGTAYVGYYGSGNSVIISNQGTAHIGTLVLNHYDGYFGVQFSNHLVIASGGKLMDLDGYIGSGWHTASGRLYADERDNWALITDPGSVWSNQNSLAVGRGGYSSSMIVSNGGQVYDTIGYMGYVYCSSNNMATITGAGSVWGSSSNLYIGNGGASNVLYIANSGRVAALAGYIGNENVASNNRVIVTGSDSVWSNASDIFVGYSGSWNSLVLTNSGFVLNDTGYVGFNASASNNSVVLTGPSPVWSNRSGVVYVGYAGSSNSLVLKDGQQFVAGTGYLGYAAGAIGNRVSLTGGSAWNVAGDLFVGYGGSSNFISLVAGNELHTQNGYIGQAASATGNFVSVTGAGAVWDNRMDLHVGVNGSGSRLTVNAGGQVIDEVGYIGSGAGARSNGVVITGGGIWSNRSGLVYVGYQGAGNSLTVNAGSTLTTLTGYVGYAATANNNSATISDAGSAWLNGGELFVGVAGDSNRLTVAGQGRLADVTGYLGYAGNANRGTVTGAGSVWSNQATLYIGYQGQGNVLVITNGGLVQNAWGVLGAGAGGDSNTVIVTGATSLWVNDCALTVGDAGQSNELRIANAGQVVATNVVVGASAGTGNRLTLAGGALVVTNPAVTGLLDVRHGALILTGGTVTVDQLRLTNGASSVLVLNTGTLTSRDSIFSNAAPLVVGDTGSGGAAFVGLDGDQVVAGNLIVGNESARNAVIVSNGATLHNDTGFLGYTAAGSNNSVTVTGGGSTWSNAFDIQIGYVGRSNRLTVAGGTVLASNVFVGQAGAVNALVVTNGGLLQTQAGWIGYGAASTNNSVTVTGTGSVWTNRSDVVIGQAGLSNRLTVAAGARLVNAQTYLGYLGGAGYNTATVTGSGAVWEVAGNLLVGHAAGAGNNSVVVSNAGLLVSTTGYIGGNSSSNTLTVASTASAWSNRGDVVVGCLGTGNRLNVAGGLAVASNVVIGLTGAVNAASVTGGGRLVGQDGYLGFAGASSNNSALVGGTGSIWSNRQNLYLGYASAGNALVVSNGGRVESAFGYLGYSPGAGSNTATITGANAVWQNRQLLAIGTASDGNQLWVTNAGAVIAGSVLLGNPSSDGNQIVISGGRLMATNGVGTGELEVCRGLLAFNGGTISADRFILTNSAASAFQFNAGTLSNRTTVISNGADFVVGNWGGATFVGQGGLHTVAGNILVGSQSVANAFILTGGAALQNTTTYFGFENGSGGNAGTVTGSGSVWTSTGQVYVGYAGVSNRLTIAAAGRLLMQNAILGYGVASSNNVGTVTGAGSVWTNRDELTVGYSGSSNSLVAASGGLLFSATGYIGREAGAGSNRLMVTGSGSVWANETDLFVGAALGSGNNSLVVTNGGKAVNNHAYVGYLGDNNSAFVVGGSAVWSNRGDLYVGHAGASNMVSIGASGRVQSGYGYIGYAPTSSNNMVIVNGSNAIWSNQYDLVIGQGGGGNSVVVTNNGCVSAVRGSIGALGTSAGNAVWVTGAGAFWTNTANLFVGENGAGNRLTVAEGGKVHNATGYVGYAASSTGNTVAVAGNGALWNNRDDLYVGYAGAANQLTITNGGKVLDRTAYIGCTVGASNNLVSVTGSGALWTNTTGLYVGYASASNRLLVAGGSVFATNLVVGQLASASNNVVQVESGTLVVTNAARQATLVLGQAGRSTLILNGGTVAVDVLVATNGNVLFNSGMLQVRGGTITSATPLAVGDGAQAATLNLAGSGTLALTSGATIRNNATLSGAGTITGAISLAAGGSLAPGNSIGTLAVNGALSLAPTSLLRFECGAPGVNDLVQVSGNLTVGGTLTVADLSGFTTGTYTLFTYTGNLTTNSLVRVSPVAGNLTGVLDYGSGSNSTIKLITATNLDPYVEYGYYYFGTTNDFGAATADPDGDGMSNEKEFIAGTNPLDPQSVLRITSVEMVGNDVLVTWQTSGGDAMFSTAGKTNLIEWTEDLRAGFSNTLATVYLPCCGDVSTNLVDTSVAGAKSRFYRVRVLP